MNDPLSKEEREWLKNNPGGSIIHDLPRALATIAELEKERDTTETNAVFLIKKIQDDRDTLWSRQKKLVEALNAAAPVVCSYACPSVWITEKGATHSSLCVQITEALKWGS